MIYNDGQAFMNPDGDMRAQNVMDNLNFRREQPVMIGVFINPGRRPDQPEPPRRVGLRPARSCRTRSTDTCRMSIAARGSRPRDVLVVLRFRLSQFVLHSEPLAAIV
jgi:hypothetical protein